MSCGYQFVSLSRPAYIPFVLLAAATGQFPQFKFSDAVRMMVRWYPLLGV
jgi:hypothetical protein